MAAITGASLGDAGGARLVVWDVRSGRHSEIAAPGARCLAFGGAGEPIVVTGHADGVVRVWDPSGPASVRSLRVGPAGVEDVIVVAADGEQVLITLDDQATVGWWSLRTGERLATSERTTVFSIAVGRSTEGREVLAAGGHRLSLWDAGAGTRLPLPSSRAQAVSEVAVLVWSTVGGRDALTLVTSRREIVTFDVAAGEQLAPEIIRHVNDYSQGLHWIWQERNGRPRLASINGILAVPTRGRVHLWDLATSTPAGPPLAGPVGRSMLGSVEWDGRAWLLTGSAQDGVIGVWDLEVPVTRSAGHDEQVGHVRLPPSGRVVVSVDDEGIIMARRPDDGRPVAPATVTDVQCAHTLAVWQEGDRVLAATGSGTSHSSDRWLRRWDVIAQEQLAAPIDLNASWLRHLAVASVQGVRVLVTATPMGRLEVWRADDGVRLAAVEVPRSLMRLVAADLDGRPVVILSTTGEPPMVFHLDDMTAPPRPVPQLDDDFVAAVAGTRVVTGLFAPGRDGWRVVRGRDLAGTWRGPDVEGAAISSVAIAAWPAVYVARADGTVSLTNLETGADLCPRLELPIAPRSIAATDDGDLIVAFGADLARFRPDRAATAPRQPGDA
ncbi:WD40 repeat domain-containing protein [Dactylosporangium sp. NBC_01737]|uniref:WD40 repeat domain-containing protein n=1 Tax=Dactylosporangium sp. NBC_01737 TaxID=2975959 RepID=UPI002E101120|nr:WD40 repeat domain-containing protein [Dactylosporangium sp. NBC_01737]